MIHPLSWVVLLVTLAATAWLVHYVRVALPREAEKRLMESMKAFSSAIELRFPSHKGSTDAVVELSLVLGKRLQLSRLQLLDLEMAARLRDIGLSAIPYALVNGRDHEGWSPAEKATYERHPEISGSMLESVESLRHLIDIVRFHHTPYQSTPDIPSDPVRAMLQANIIHVACEYIWAERRKGESRAYDLIIGNEENLFNPIVVEALKAVLTSTRVEERRPSLVH